MEFSNQESWSGKSFPSPRDLPYPGIKPRSPALQILYHLSHQGSLDWLTTVLFNRSLIWNLSDLWGVEAKQFHLRHNPWDVLIMEISFPTYNTKNNWLVTVKKELGLYSQFHSLFLNQLSSEPFQIYWWKTPILPSSTLTCEAWELTAPSWWVLIVDQASQQVCTLTKCSRAILAPPDRHGNPGLEDMPTWTHYVAFPDIPSLCWAFWIAQLVKNPPAMQETPVRFLGGEKLLEKE